MIKDYSSREDGAMGRRIDPLLSYFSFQPMHHDWYELSVGYKRPLTTN